ncbi:MAG: hypothetical protein J5J06_19165 [Phycisphaerae bacterium]|nr:hypothetical protein [Phycisphaerae bacterium]
MSSRNSAMRAAARRVRRVLLAWLALLAFGMADSLGAASVALNPVKDGTLVDGGEYGVFDGVADAADWTFNDSAFLEGAISLFFGEPPREYRVVWEYNLGAVNFVPPVVARLQFSLRPAAIYVKPTPPPIPVQVVSYPADLVESLSDFQAGPAVLQGAVLVPRPYPPPTTSFRINVSDLVNKARQDGAPGVAFRFQIEDVGSDTSMQAFIDALDSDPTTKPILTIYDRMPGDFNENDVVGLDDLPTLAACIAGPGQTPPIGCTLPDQNLDNDVDLADAAAFLMQFGSTR